MHIVCFQTRSSGERGEAAAGGGQGERVWGGQGEGGWGAKCEDELMVLCILKRTHSVVREHILDDRLMVLCILAGARHSQDYARANARTCMRVCAPAYARMGIDVHAYRYIDISRIHAQTTCVCTDTYACVRVQGYRHIQPVYRGGQAPRRHAERLQHQKKKQEKKRKNTEAKEQEQNNREKFLGEKGTLHGVTGHACRLFPPAQGVHHTFKSQKQKSTKILLPPSPRSLPYPHTLKAHT